MEIYAELSKNVLKHKFLKWLPPGVVLRRSGKSRACTFECEDEFAKGDLVNLLENNEICYQDMDEEEKKKNED